MARATLFDVSTGARKQVEVGSSNAFGVSPEEAKRGITAWKLETPTQNFQTYQAPTREIFQGPGTALYAGGVGETPRRILNPAELSTLVNEGGYQDIRRPLSFAGGGAPAAELTSGALPGGFGVTGGATSVSGVASVSGAAGGAGGVNPASSFNFAISELLRQGQGANQGDADLLAQRNALINARFNAINEITPENLRVLTPGQQAALRSGEYRGLETQLGGVNTALQARERERAGAKDMLELSLKIFEAQDKTYGTDPTAQNQIRDDARASLKFIYDSFGAGAIQKLPASEKRSWEQKIGLPPGTLDYASEAEKTGRYKIIAATKYHGTLRFDTQTGKYVNEAGQAIPTPAGAPVAGGAPSARTTTATSTGKLVGKYTPTERRLLDRLGIKNDADARQFLTSPTAFKTWYADQYSPTGPNRSVPAAKQYWSKNVQKKTSETLSTPLWLSSKP